MNVCRGGFKFDAAHCLPDYQGKCARLHGHTWRLDVEVAGPVAEDGFVVDFTELKKAVQPVVDVLDHDCLNNLGLPFSLNPTCENVLDWLWRQLKGRLEDSVRPGRELVRLRLYESSDSYAEKKKEESSER